MGKTKKVSKQLTAAALTDREATIVRCLAKHGPQTPGEIADRVFEVTKRSTAREFDRAVLLNQKRAWNALSKPVHLGFVEKRDDATYALTRKGRALLARVLQTGKWL